MSEPVASLQRALASAQTASGILDIILVWLLVYSALSILRGAGQPRWRGLGLGVMILVVAWLATGSDRGIVRLDTFHWLLTALAPSAAMAMVVVFQPEIRQSLRSVGQWNFFASDTGPTRGAVVQVVNEVVDAAERLAAAGRGALFVLQRRDSLHELIETGCALDSQVSRELLTSIFYSNGPLHDGAVIIADGRVAAATCLLPLSERRDISLQLGTRHRAALGVTERTDAVVVVVSEETQIISVTVGGELSRRLTGEPLRIRLLELLQPAGGLLRGQGQEAPEASL